MSEEATTPQVDPSFHLFLDDTRVPQDVTWIRLPTLVPWTVVRNYEQFKNKILEKGIPKFISFDHDLGEKEASGYDCVNWFIHEVLLNNNIQFPEYTVHSMNPIGAENIKELISSYRRYLLGIK